MIYFTAREALTTTAEVVAAAAEIDRMVHLTETLGQVYVGFTNTTAEVSLHAVEDKPNQFVLPAGVELWAVAHSSTPAAEVVLLVTSIGR